MNYSAPEHVRDDRDTLRYRTLFINAGVLSGFYTPLGIINALLIGRPFLRGVTLDPHNLLLFAWWVLTAPLPPLAYVGLRRHWSRSLLGVMVGVVLASMVLTLF